MSTFWNANIGNYFVMHYFYSPKMTFMPTFWNDFPYYTTLQRENSPMLMSAQGSLLCVQALF